MGLWDYIFGKRTAQPEGGAFVWPAGLEPEEALVGRLAEQSMLPCAVCLPDAAVPQEDSGTLLGAVRVGRPGEAWPLWKGEPMAGICQLDLTAAPFVPPELEGFAFLALFFPVDARGEVMPPFTAGEPDEFLIRLYRVGEPLVRYTAPRADYDTFRPMAVRYQTCKEMHTNPEALWNLRESHGLPQDVLDRLRARYQERFRATCGDSLPWRTKLGGWPAPIQSDTERPITFQVGDDIREGEVGFSFGDGGCFSFWYDREHDRWEALFECY